MSKKFIGGVVALSPVAAFAAVPASVGTAFTDLQTDLLTVAGYGVALVAATVGIWMIIKYLKRGAHQA